MGHFIFIYFLLLTLTGVGLTAILIYYTFQTKNRLVDFLALFYGLFTFDTSLGILNRYLNLNLQETYNIFFDYLVVMNSIARAAVLWSILVLFHHLVVVKRSKWITIEYTVLLVCGLAFRSELNIITDSFHFNAWFPQIDVLDIASILLFLYLMFVVLWSKKPLEGSEKRFLVKAILIVFGLALLLSLIDKQNFLSQFAPLSSWVFIFTTLVLSLFLRKFNSYKLNVGNTPTLDSQVYNSLDFTQTERAVLEMIINGDSNNEIAQKLSISISAVKSHIRDIYKKMNAK